jgi:hypothetical protein
VFVAIDVELDEDEMPLEHRRLRVKQLRQAAARAAPRRGKDEEHFLSTGVRLQQCFSQHYRPIVINGRGNRTPVLTRRSVSIATVRSLNGTIPRTCHRQRTWRLESERLSRGNADFLGGLSPTSFGGFSILIARPALFVPIKRNVQEGRAPR